MEHTPDRAYSRRSFLRKAGLAAGATLAAATFGDVPFNWLKRARDAKDTATLPPENEVDIWTERSVQIVFEREYDEEMVKEILEYLEKLPLPLRNALGNKGYKIILVKGKEEVQSRLNTGSDSSDLPPNGDVGGFTNLGDSEIVVDDTRNVPHEIGHAVDHLFDMQSYSDEFMPAFIIEAQKQLPLMEQLIEENTSALATMKDEEARKATQYTIDYYKARIERINTFLNAARLPKDQRDPILMANEAIFSYVVHLYTPGFLGFYYGDPPDFKVSSPELYATFQRFDERLQADFARKAPATTQAPHEAKYQK